MEKESRWVLLMENESRWVWWAELKKRFLGDGIAGSGDSSFRDSKGADFVINSNLCS